MKTVLSSARVADIKDIHALLLKAADKGRLLPRSLADLYRHTRDFYVLKEQNDSVVGCCALSVVWEDLAEIRSLYVREGARRQGSGSLLAEACMKEARAMGVGRLFTLTYETGFFARLGFSATDKDVLPQKIWADCVHCPKFPNNCDETAMLCLL
ncbi:MAG: N-acetyltransferase [Desulfovibrio sp.]|nr:N-acetyltransferase [Desulfovibrio sp.]